MSSITEKDIANFELLAGLTAKEHGPFCTYLIEKRYPAGEIVFNEGDKGGEIYFLLSGEVEISQALTLPMAKSAEYDSRAKSIIRLSSENGPVFGEVSFFSNEDKRTATVKAITDCRMGVLSEKDFFQILVSDKQVGYKILLNLIRIVCNRLVTANKNVLKLTTALSLILEK
ncbi:MAG: cyclic nucleotide-binding domain-containing protein [Fidelibacterota bacterium]|nr:MAG: cyclic nucleotide-binding domain-containing protein [Candidatus Neomarinimicrobiota bacterium]